MANTIIQIKKSIIPGNVPTVLESGELAINTADGVLFYKDPSNIIKSISTGSTSNSFSTINVNSTLLISATPNDILSISGNNGVIVTGDYVNDTIIIQNIDGSTSQKGIIQLYDGIDSNSSELAASANAVNVAYDLANNTYNYVTSIDSNTQNLLCGTINSKIILTSNNSANQILDTFSTSAYRSIKYLIQVSSGLEYQISEITLLHNGTNSYITEFGLIASNSALLSYETEIVLGNVNLLMSPINNINEIKVIKTSIL